MPLSETTDFLVIGAGLAGLAFASDARAHRNSVRLLDKGRGSGGRVATRRWDDLRVDHGAQFFTAKGRRFESFVRAWRVEPGSGLAVWAKGFPTYEPGKGVVEREPGHPRYAPRNGMSELPKRLAYGLDVRTGVTVKNIERTGEGWRATGEERGGDRATFEGRTLVLNLPPAQLLPLAGEFLAAEDRADLATVEYAPAWTLILRLAQDVEGATWPALDCEAGGHPTLAWISRDHTKRGDADAPPVLVAHGSGAWSREHLEDDPAAVQEALLAAVTEITGPLEVLDTQVHRWRYALCTKPFPDRCLFRPEIGVLGCGDWCDVGGRVEGALTSGWHLAGRTFAEPVTA